MVIAMRLDRLPDGASNAEIAGYHGSVAPGVWSFQMAARARGLGSAWTTFHLFHEDAVAELLGIPETVTQVALLPVGFYKGDEFTPAPRRPAAEITYFNRWKQTID
jgi:nitroreductase